MGVGGGPRKCLVINDLQMLASTNTFTIRANVAQPCKLNADSFRARRLVVEYALGMEKNMTKEQLQEILDKVWVRDWSPEVALDAIWKEIIKPIENKD